MGKKAKIFAEGVKAVFRGELLLKLKFDKYMAHIVVAAVAVMVILLCKCMVENVQIRRERMKSQLEEAQWKHQQTTVELVGMGRMSTVEEMLRKNNVNIGKPEKPATIIEK